MGGEKVNSLKDEQTLKRAKAIRDHYPSNTRLLENN